MTPEEIKATLREAGEHVKFLVSRGKDTADPYAFTIAMMAIVRDYEQSIAPDIVAGARVLAQVVKDVMLTPHPQGQA